MTNRQNEFVIGLAMAIAIVIVVVSVLWLGKSNFFIKGTTINMLVDNANGIINGEEILYRGIKIGSVSDAIITKNNVLLKLKIEKANNIPKDSKFVIKDYSMISGKIVEIIPGNSTYYLQPGDTVKGSVAFGLNNMVADLKDLKPKINKILSNVDTLTGNEFQSNLNTTLSNLNSTIKSLRNILNSNLKNTFANIDEIITNNKKDVSFLIKSFSKRSEELSQFLNSSNNTVKKLDSLIAAINNNKGTLGKLIKNKSLYNNLDRTLISLDSLLTDFKNNPDKYINVSVF